VPGWYTITLNVSDAAGNSAIDTLTLEVLDVTKPTADAGSNANVNEDALYTFDASTSSDNVGIAYYTWDIDESDGLDWITPDYNGSNLFDPSHIYTEPGDYTVTLRVTDAAGNSDTDTVVITVLDITSPTAHAGQDDTIDEDTTLLFNASASSDNVGITNYAWDMDASDGIDWGNPDYTGASKIYVMHTFTEPGIYEVTLNTTDAAGNSHTDFITITVIDITQPEANAGPDDAIDEDTVYTFNGSGSTDNVGIANYAWDIKDEDGIDWSTPDYSGANLWNPAHTYAEPGTYTVTLNVTDAQGKWDTDSLIIVVYDVTAPELNVELTSTMDEDTEYEFNASGSRDDGGIATYYFSFGDGIELEDAESVVTHTYSEPGTYTVTVNITDNAGNWNTTSWLVTVKDITPPLKPAGLTVSRVPNGSALYITWLPNSEEDLDHYVLYYGFDGESYQELDEISINSTSYLHSGLANGLTYYYYIVAVDDSGLESEPSNEVSGVPDKDSDNDELYDSEDPDDDNDGVDDDIDLFPDNPYEHSDFDGDGIGDNADLDDDNDEHLDEEDAFPFDRLEYLDTDGDGIGNNADDDDDGDGVKDKDDPFPLDSSKSEEPLNVMTLLFLMIALIAIVITIILAIMLSLQKSENKELNERVEELEEEKALTQQMQVTPAPVVAERPRPRAAPRRPPTRPPARRAAAPQPMVITEETPRQPSQPSAEAPSTPEEQPSATPTPTEEPAPPTPPPKPGEMPPPPGEVQEGMPPPPPPPAPEELPPPTPEDKKPKTPEPEE
jgi:PKD repeat protein